MPQRHSLIKDPYTGLILVSGVDAPGITQALFDTLAAFAITILDIEQVVIRERVILTVLISMNPAHSQAIEADLSACAQKLNIDIAVSFSQSSQENLAAKTNLIHVTAIGAPLKPVAIASIAAELTLQEANIERIFRTASHPVTAVEFVISGGSLHAIRSALSLISLKEKVDIAVQAGGLMRWAKKLILIDVDSTLIQQEVIELLGAHAGVGAEIKLITDRAMNGEMDFEESLRQRVHLLSGLSSSILEKVQSEILLTPGAKTLITTLQRLGHNVAVVSGGFIQVIEPILKDLGIDLYRANELEIKNGALTGNLLGPIIDRAAKARVLREFAEQVGVELEQTIAIGDGANDLDMIALAGLGIAFNAKPSVRATADSSVSVPYLDSVLYLMGITREDGQ